MRLPILLGPALLLAACGTGGETENTVNADQSLSAESFSSNDITAIDAVTGDASNMAADINYLVEADNALDADGGGDRDDSAPAKGSAAPKRPAGETATANRDSAEPAANESATATANNAL